MKTYVVGADTIQELRIRTLESLERAKDNSRINKVYLMIFDDNSKIIFVKSS